MDARSIMQLGYVPPGPVPQHPLAQALFDVVIPQDNGPAGSKPELEQAGFEGGFVAYMACTIRPA